MKIKQVFIAGIGVLAFSLLNVAQADDLLQVYNQALHDDPTFKQAQSTWWSAKQNLPIAVSAYLPQISLLNTYERVYASTNPPAANGMGWHTQNVLTLTATQAIFDYSAWTNIREQAASVKSATATYLASIQDLMSRTASAYFSVLQAYDQLSLTIAQKKAVKRQLVTAQQKFKVGLIAITGVYDAQSSYDTKNADEISDRNSLYNALENLRAITGQHYLTLQGVRVQVPLVRPIPDNINIWVATAQRQNYSLESANYTTIQQHENILNQAAAYMPTLDATTSYADTRNWNYQNGFGGGAKANRITQAGDYGLSLAWTPFQGGKTFYSIRQARADYLTALGKLESTHRDVINQTRQAFLGVSSGISRIRADRQAIVSTRNALKATEAGYLVGTRTMVNVLDELTKVNQAEFAYRKDQYTYVNDIIALKEEAGTLNIHDLQQINSWLEKRIVFPLPKNYYSHDISEETPAMAKLRVLDEKTAGLTIPGGYSLATETPTQRHAAPKTKTKAMKRVTSTSVRPVAMAKPAGDYVVQLYAGDTKQSARTFVNRSGVKQRLRVVKHGKIYKVLYGHFKSRSDALVGLDALPINHAKARAWVFKTPHAAAVHLPVPHNI